MAVKSMMLVALMSHAQQFETGSKHIEFMVPGGFYPHGRDRFFKLPLDKFETRPNPNRKGQAARQVFADTSYCYAHQIERITRDPVTRDRMHR